MSDKVRTFYMYAPTVTVSGQKLRARKPPKPNLASELKQANKAGQPVKAATITADSVTLTFGQPEEEPPSNDLDKWLAKHAH
jgi:hypothetical protein